MATLALFLMNLNLSFFLEFEFKFVCADSTGKGEAFCATDMGEFAPFGQPTMHLRTFVPISQV